MRALACALLALAACGENATPVGEPPSPFAASCVPDLDGTLTAAELPIVLDQPLTFRVGVAAAVLGPRGPGVDRVAQLEAQVSQLQTTVERLCSELGLPMSPPGQA